MAVKLWVSSCPYLIRGLQISRIQKSRFISSCCCSVEDLFLSFLRFSCQDPTRSRTPKIVFRRGPCFQSRDGAFSLLLLLFAKQNLRLRVSRRHSDRRSPPSPGLLGELTRRSDRCTLHSGKRGSESKLSQRAVDRRSGRCLSETTKREIHAIAAAGKLSV